MSRQLINRSPDLLKLRNEGYDISVEAGYLIVKHIPYVTANKEVAYGTLVSELSLGGDATTTPSTHVTMFAGEKPHMKDGIPFDKIINESVTRTLAEGLTVNYSFSSKPAQGYPDYYDKMTTYATILLSQAQAIEPDVTATPYPIIEDTDEDSVFHYIDTASSRAGISAISLKLAHKKIAIVGLGGTGAYILDLVAKTPVGEIHLFDGDSYLQHNAFRTPGAPSLEDLRQVPKKVAYLAEVYAKMRRGIVAHDTFVDETNVLELEGMDFVFLALDDGAAKRPILAKLEELGIPFIDVGMGVYEVEGTLSGLARVTTSTEKQRKHIHSGGRIPLAGDDVHNEYSRNIQIADLNALNAALAVIKWKKLMGFYLDLEKEHHSFYQLDGNYLTNEDQL